MSYKILFIIILGAILQCIYDIFITDKISKHEAKKVSCNCEKCENWRCYYKYCKKQRDKYKNV